MDQVQAPVNNQNISPLQAISSLTSLSSLSTDSVILNEIFKILDNTFKCDKSFKIKLLNIFTNSLNIAAIFIIQYLVKNPDKITSFFKFILIKLFYKKININLDKKTYESNLFNKLQKDLNPKNDKTIDLNYNRLPIYLNTINDHTCYIELCPIVHDSFMNKYIEESKISYEEENKIISKEAIKTNLKDVKKNIFTPDILYPSYNYTRLDNIIERFFCVVNKTRMYKAQGILIDGEPGLGKSRSCDYLASLNKYHEIIYINMSLTDILKKDFKTVITSFISSKKSGSIIIYFDELDKYLDYNLDHMFKLYLEKIKKEQVSKIQEKQEQEQIIIIEEKINQEEEYKNFHLEYKQNFLYDLLELVETSTYDDGIVFIFCSNNFNTIFEGVNQMHFNSLKSRFAPINFERCNYDEVVGYINYFNNMMKDTCMYYDQEIIDRLVDKLDQDILLTYRSIRHLHISAGYDIKKFIDMINNYDSSSSPVIYNRPSPDRSYNTYVSSVSSILSNQECDNEEINNIDNLVKPDLSYDVSKYKDIKKFKILISSNRINEIFAVINSGFDVNQVDEYNKTPLMYAVEHRNYYCVVKLIKHGALINIMDNEGKTALHYSILGNFTVNSSLVEVLLKYGADMKV